MAATLLPWAAGCGREAGPLPGVFNGADPARGHRLRESSRATPAAFRRTDVLIAGGGIAGLAAARALRARGIEDFTLLEMEDQPGGNSRGGETGGLPCPLGAHYLPVPGDEAPAVLAFLEEVGLRRRVAGRWTWDERHQCHSPQERLFFNGEWQEGLLPLQGVGEGTLAQYRRFAALVQEAGAKAKFSMPAPARAAPSHLALDAMTFEAWLDAAGLADPHLRWYLDYCCRDDYGCGIAAVSAWAGIHYFASRHGFHPPGAEGSERETLFTWPEGNGWLARHLSRPAGARIRSGSVVVRIAALRHGVEVDAADAATGEVTRWTARRCVVALPAFIAARVVEGLPGVLRARAAGVRHAPWLVANIHIDAPLADRPGAPASWDNVLYGSAGLGYVDARHQSLSPLPGPTVLTWYRALGDVPGARRMLLDTPLAGWQDEVLRELSLPHPDLRRRTTRIDVARYGHAMAVPVPGTLAALPPREALLGAAPRLAFAHADWAGYSVFEEAFTLGDAAGKWAA
ncbi:MAG: FAD-dependent oxidoreductase [Burkholderiaceae bacterium]